MSLVPSLKVANLGTLSFTVNSFLSYLRLTVKIFQFLRLSAKFLAVLRLSVNPIETLFQEIPAPRLPPLSRFWAADFWYSKMAAHIARKALYVYGAFCILLFAKASYDCESKYLHLLR